MLCAHRHAAYQMAFRGAAQNDDDDAIHHSRFREDVLRRAFHMCKDPRATNDTDRDDRLLLDMHRLIFNLFREDLDRRRLTM